MARLIKWLVGLFKKKKIEQDKPEPTLSKKRRPITLTPQGTRNGFGKVHNCPFWERDYLKVIPRSKRA